MSSRIKLVQGDTLPAVVVSLTDKDTGLPIDLSAAGTSILMQFRAQNSTTILQNITGTKLVGKLRDDGTIDTSNPTPGAGGRAQFNWPTGALDISPGYYEGEIQITFDGGAIQTVYDLLKFSVRADF